MRLFVKVIIDTGYTLDVYETKKTTMQNYKAVYSGPEFMIQFKYADVLNITYTAMLYGVGMPVLWPLAALAVANQRLCERI